MASNTPSSPVLFSTVCYWKYYIQRRFVNDTHYVWCSEHFDPTKQADHDPDSQTGPTSNPRAIYERLDEAVENHDTHCNKIKDQESTIRELAIEWNQQDIISEDEALDILYMMDEGAFRNWRPLLYVIPTGKVVDRVEYVPFSRRASVGDEWIIEDLDSSEFRIVEL